MSLILYSTMTGRSLAMLNVTVPGAKAAAPQLLTEAIGV